MPREPWVEKLEEGEGEAAWTLLIDQYHRLISATVRHYGKGYDDEMDLFAYVCGSLRANDFARLRKYASIPKGRVRLTTWLVAVTRNLAIDWLRQRHGRKRLQKLIAGLPSVQREAFECVFLQGHARTEAYEITRAKGLHKLTYPEFVKALVEAQKTLSATDPGRLFNELAPVARRELSNPSSPRVAAERVSGTDRADAETNHGELREWLARALESLDTEDRAAVRLYVMNDLPASEVARLLGWQSAKTVYNRVYRALSTMRRFLEEKGVEPSDLA